MFKYIRGSLIIAVIGLGLAIIAGAAYAGYWYSSQEPNDTTTIEYK